MVRLTSLVNDQNPCTKSMTIVMVMRYTTNPNIDQRSKKHIHNTMCVTITKKRDGG